LLNGKMVIQCLALCTCAVSALAQCISQTHPILTGEKKLSSYAPAVSARGPAFQTASSDSSFADGDCSSFELKPSLQFPLIAADLAPSLPDSAEDRASSSANLEAPMQPVVMPQSLVAAEKVKWRKLTMSSLRYLAVMHTFRVATEPATRQAFFNNPFWSGYFDALGAMHGWSDGDHDYENYLGHPIQGAVSGYIWIHNDPRYRYVEFGKDPDYWKSRLRAYLFAWAFSEQFEVGPLSEASIGQIQRYCCQFGFVDHVITPNGGMVWMVAGDILDKYVVRRIEDRTQNLGLRIAARIVFNPAESFANLMSLDYPWYRENRAPPSEYEAMSYLRSSKSGKRTNRTHTLVPSFEFTATVPSSMQIAGLTCLGGGGIAGFRMADRWQWTVEVSGCGLRNSLPGNWTGDSLTFSTGPQWTRHTESRWDPHAHLRLGGQKITLQQSFPAERNLIANSLPPGTGLNPYYNLFNNSYESTGLALSVGGGVDYRLYPGLALRVAGLDYLHSWLSPVNGRDFDTGIRLTTGVVLRLGTW